MKFVVVTGGVVSGLGKGITISSIGVLLRAYGLRVTSIKIDPYLVRTPGGDGATDAHSAPRDTPDLAGAIAPLCRTRTRAQ